MVGVAISTCWCTPYSIRRGVLGQGRVVDALGGHEHHDQVGGGVELALIALGGELGYVVASLARVACHLYATLLVTLGL